MLHHPDRGKIGVWIVRIFRLEAENDMGWVVYHYTLARSGNTG